MQMLIQDTTPNQRKQPKYQIHYDKDGETIFTWEHRSWIQHMLRKNLGHENVAFFIWQHGLPELLDAPWRKHAPSPEMLQGILEEGLRWHASLLQSLVAHSTDPQMEHARRTLEPHYTFQKRRYDEMSATEQPILEDYDTLKLRKRVDEASLRVDRKPFRGVFRLDAQQPPPCQ